MAEEKLLAALQLSSLSDSVLAACFRATFELDEAGVPLSFGVCLTGCPLFVYCCRVVVFLVHRVTYSPQLRFSFLVRSAVSQLVSQSVGQSVGWSVGQSLFRSAVLFLFFPFGN